MLHKLWKENDRDRACDKLHGDHHHEKYLGCPSLSLVAFAETAEVVVSTQDLQLNQSFTRCQ